MRSYTATFHTHLSAMLTCRALTAAGIEARMQPTPRSLSSACGTSVMYKAKSPEIGLMDADTQAVYECVESGFVLVEQLS